MNVSTLLIGITGGAAAVAYCTVPQFKDLADKTYTRVTQLSEKMEGLAKGINLPKTQDINSPEAKDDKQRECKNG